MALVWNYVGHEDDAGQGPSGWSLLDVLGDVGTMNIQGEAQQKLDVYANEALLHCLRMREDVAILASEEDDDLVMFEGRGQTGKYIVLVDPLDGLLISM